LAERSEGFAPANKHTFRGDKREGEKKKFDLEKKKIGILPKEIFPPEKAKLRRSPGGDMPHG